MNSNLLRLSGIAAVLALGGLLFAWSGLYNVAATTGHWPSTAWFLHFAMKASVETHARGEAPPLESPTLIEKGASHFQAGCAPCHGAPGDSGNLVLQTMVPPPPNLALKIDDWSTEELFWIVKHGIKYAGMPAWPAQTRDDEVWAITAFLLTLPELSQRSYAALANVEAAGMPYVGSSLSATLSAPTAGALVDECARCHGIDGAGRPSGAFPRIDIQEAAYLERALSEYAAGLRPSGIMQPIAAALDTDDIAGLASYFGETPAVRDGLPAAAEDVSLDLGRRVAIEGFPDRHVAACSTCHGLEEGPNNPLFPALAGQYDAFTRAQLHLWKDGSRGSGPYSDIMRPIVAKMSTEEIEAVARFYASLPRVGSRPAEPVEVQLGTD